MSSTLAAAVRMRSAPDSNASLSSRAATVSVSPPRASASEGVLVQHVRCRGSGELDADERCNIVDGLAHRLVPPSPSRRVVAVAVPDDQVWVQRRKSFRAEFTFTADDGHRRLVSAIGDVWIADAVTEDADRPNAVVPQSRSGVRVDDDPLRGVVEGDRVSVSRCVTPGLVGRPGLGGGRCVATSQPASRSVATTGSAAEPASRRLIFMRTFRTWRTKLGKPNLTCRSGVLGVSCPATSEAIRSRTGE